MPTSVHGIRKGSRGHGDIARALLRHGARAGAETNDDRTAAHVAAAQGHDEILRIVLDAGAPIEGRDRNGATPLLFAVMEGRRAATETLLARGADPNARVKGYSALRLATLRRHADVADILRRYGARE